MSVFFAFFLQTLGFASSICGLCAASVCACTRARVLWGQVNGFLISFYSLTYFMAFVCMCCCCFFCSAPWVWWLGFVVAVDVEGIAFVCSIARVTHKNTRGIPFGRACVQKYIEIFRGVIMFVYSVPLKGCRTRTRYAK